MTWITWGEKQASGHAGMDRAHRKLVDLINQLAEGMENNKPKAFCNKTLDQFIEHAGTHFFIEEQLMDRHRYPKAKEHKALHAKLTKDVLAFKALYDAGGTADFIILYVILESWLARDMGEADKELADFIATAG